MKVAELVEYLLEQDEDLDVKLQCSGKSEQDVGEVLIGDGNVLLISPEAMKNMSAVERH